MFASLTFTTQTAPRKPITHGVPHSQLRTSSLPRIAKFPRKLFTRRAGSKVHTKRSSGHPALRVGSRHPCRYASHPLLSLPGRFAPSGPVRFAHSPSPPVGVSLRSVILSPFAPRPACFGCDRCFSASSGGAGRLRRAVPLRRFSVSQGFLPLRRPAVFLVRPSAAPMHGSFRPAPPVWPIRHEREPRPLRGRELGGGSHVAEKLVR